MVTSASPSGGRFSGAIENAISHALGTQRLVALFAKNQECSRLDCGPQPFGPTMQAGAGTTERDHGRRSQND